MTDLTFGSCDTAQQALRVALESQDSEAVQSRFGDLVECAKRTREAAGLAPLLGEVGIQLSRLTELPEVFAHLLEVAQEEREQASIEHEWGTVLVRLGQYAEAEPHLLRALSLRRRIHGSDLHADVVATLNALGTLHYAAGRFTEALEFLNQVVAICDTLDLWTLKTAGVHVNLGNIETYRSNYRAAENHFLRVVEVWEAAGQPPHFVMVGNWVGLGTAATYQFQHTRAKEWYERALEMHQQLFGDKLTIMVAGINHNLGNVFAGLGRHEEAVRYYLDSLRIKREIFGSDLHPDILLTVEALSVTYREVEQTELAEQYSALAIRLAHEIHGDAPHLDTIATVTSAAALQERLGNREAAVTGYKQALEMALNYPGGAPLFETALLHLRLGQLGLADKEEQSTAEHFQQALILSQKMYGEASHPNFAEIYHGQARLALLGGNVQASWDLAQRERDELRRLGELTTPDMWIASDELISELHVIRGEFGAAAEVLHRALTSHLAQLPAIMSLAGQSAIAVMNQRREKALARLLSLVCKHPELHPQVETTYEVWLNFKGSASALDMGLRTLTQSRPELKPLFEELQAARRRLVMFRNEPQAAEALTEAQQQYRAAELALRKEAREIFDLQQVTLQQLYASLPDNAVLLDYALLDGRYFAFCISTKNREVKLHEVGSQEAIDALIQECRQSLHPESSANLELFRDPAGFAAQLHGQLIGSFSLSDQVIVSPDAELHALPFDLLFDAMSGLFLLEQCSLRLIPCGRDLIRLRRDALLANGAPLLIGWPDFQAKAGEIEKQVGFDLLNEVETHLDDQSLLLEVQPSGDDALAAIAIWQGTTGLQAASTADYGVSRQTLAAAGSAEELIRTLFPGQTISPKTKTFLLQTQAADFTDVPGIVPCPDLRVWLQEHHSQSEGKEKPSHFPLHSFTGTEPEQLTLMGHSADLALSPLPSTFTQVVSIRQAMKGLEPLTYSGAAASTVSLHQALQTTGEPTILHITTHGLRRETEAGEPMEQAVLFLAGAGDSDPQQRRQGELSAFEFAGLNLRGTKLVNLATCQSGLGQTLKNEGQYGFVAASFLAGARATMTTLWSVESRSTERLMVDFYRSWLRTGGEASAVLSNLKRQRVQAGVKPFYWAGFVVHGS